ncbi:hypothetical protein D8674_034692 [Pyrus ussuriensis x Pyrus communis]|uniref:Transmembrane protein n=1 Tax=Pyrus ussuriensis x Pyrus communis TaxID=2448454 RepID=A0A5N5GAE1_9ROSA|nr:hypothetical protein D8674_034692 [Pyrus ussuriensis x Pyrus communis]
MDESSSALIEAILREQEEEEAQKYGRKLTQNGDAYAWQTVSYSKRNRKSSSKALLADSNPDLHNGVVSSASDVFRPIELHSEERRRRVLEAQAAAVSGDAAPGASKRTSDDDDEGDSDGEVAGAAVENGEVKKVKQKKPKKPKVTVAEAASKMDAGDLGAFLADITASYNETQQDIQLMRLADYFGRAFAAVSPAQFPWLKTFKESSVAKLVDIPLSHVSDDVYKISVEWIGQRSTEALGSFVLWSLDSILADLATHQGVAKGSKKVVQQAPSKSQVAIFVVLAMVLRRRPEVLISLVPVMRGSPKYEGQDKLPITVWLVAQASQGDLVVGLYSWVQFLLPILSSKSSSNPLCRDLILQSVERILAFPKARPILLNGAVRKGEHIVPPSALDLLMRVSFPAPSARVKATERFEAVYPTLKEIALAGSPGSKTMRQVTQQILKNSVKAVNEGIPDLSKEASGLFIWCLTQNPECYRQWDVLYLDNLDASVVLLKKLSDEWKEQSVKHASLDPLRETLKSFREKNDKALAAGGDDAARHSLLKDADKYCKQILGRFSQGHVCMKSMVLVSVALAVGAAVMSQNIQPGDLKKFVAMFNLPPTF